jgi:N utilization substance protein B
MKPSFRRKSRQYAVQALYQWQMADADPAEIETQFLSDFNFKKADIEYFHLVLQGVSEHVGEIDAKLIPLLDRPIKELGPVELSILRLSSYELLFCLDVPYKVVINEGINLTKEFGSTDAHKYINGVLDKLASRLRSSERQA